MVGETARLHRFFRPTTLLAQVDRVVIKPRIRVASYSDSLGRLLDYLGDPTPPPVVTGRVVDGWLTIPEGLGYPVTRQHISGLRRE